MLTEKQKTLNTAIYETRAYIEDPFGIKPDKACFISVNANLYELNSKSTIKLIIIEA